MSIIRREKNENYTVIHNEIFRRGDLTARALGIYAYIMTLPDDWKLYQKELWSHFTEGRDALRTAFKELEEKGYITKKQTRDGNSQFDGWEYTIIEKSRITENPNSENQLTGNPKLLSTNQVNTNNTKLSKDSNSSKAANAPNRYQRNLKKPNKSLRPKFLEIIRQLKDEGKFPLKIPDERNPSPTKKVIEIQDLLQQLLSGTFKKSNHFDEGWSKNIDFDTLSKITDHESLIKVFKKAFRRYAMMHQGGYYPQNKSILTRCLKEFIYSPRTGKSYFLTCLSSPPKLIKEKVDGEQVEKLREEFTDKELQVVDNIMIEKEWYDSEYDFLKKTHVMKEWYKKSREELKLVNDAFSGISSFSCILILYKDFIFAWDSFTMGNYGHGNKSWDKFVSEMMRQFGFILEPSQSDIDREKRQLEKLRRIA